MKELYNLYRSCFEGADVTVRDRFNDICKSEKTNIIKELDSDGGLIGAAITNDNAVAAIFVREDKRNQGIGKRLLSAAEKDILSRGHKTAVLGGPIYQGAPINGDNIKFFEKRGYIGDYTTVNMAAKLADFDIDKLDIYPSPEYIRFRYEMPGEHDKLLKAVNEVEPNWVQYFSEPKEDNPEKTLIAEDTRNGNIAGFVMSEPGGASFEHSGLKTSAMGCVGVVPEYRRSGIGLRMVADGMQRLKEQGEQAVELTYIVLIDWYSRLGLKVCSRQWMAEKKLV